MSDKKRIEPNLTSRISIMKAHIRNSNGRGFDGNGYIFKEAVRQLKKEEHKITHNRKNCSYYLM